ncbi:hypothetical protein BFJ67_g17592 [Fusarium oxysporum f. sp. cepae]|nr:hypothetical protein BFJ67_g17592 [Fusarium oxysporum f. sp. cepae]
MDVDVSKFGLQERYVGINKPNGLRVIALNDDASVVKGYAELGD